MTPAAEYQLALRQERQEQSAEVDDVTYDAEWDATVRRVRS